MDGKYWDSEVKKGRKIDWFAVEAENHISKPRPSIKLGPLLGYSLTSQAQKLMIFSQLEVRLKNSKIEFLVLFDKFQTHPKKIIFFENNC